MTAEKRNLARHISSIFAPTYKNESEKGYMKKWDKSYTYAICTVVFFAIIFLVANQADNRSFRFAHSDLTDMRAIKRH